MTRTVTATAVKRIISKGLTGWEAGKLALQDVVDCYLHRESVLTDADLETLRSVPTEGADVRDYNMFMALCRGFHFGYMLGEWACVDACLQISFLDEPLRDANKRRIVELYESCGPRVVTRKQYEDIVAAQRQKKLEFEYSLAYVIEERFYAIAPSGAREEIDDAREEYESVADFVSAVPEKYKGFCKQAIDEIRHLHTSGKLPAVYHGRGCTKCRFTGYQGRTAIAELLLVSERIREMTISMRHSNEIDAQARKEGMTSLFLAGVDKVHQGITTYDEVLKATKGSVVID